MDAVQKVKDLSNLALDERGSKEERLNAAVGALRIIQEYNLLAKKRVEVAANFIETITNPAIAEVVASRAEKIADSVDRVLGSVKRVSDKLSQAAGNGGGRRVRARRYTRR